MRQYEIAIRIAQVHHLAEERKYKKALTVIQTLDMRQVRNISDLKVFAEVRRRQLICGFIKSPEHAVFYIV